MNESFKKLKKRFLKNSIIKSVICGVSFGLLATGAALISLKLAKVAIHPAFYALIGVVCALAAGGCAFLFLRPTNKKIAKKLDKEYALEERIQTMVEFSDSESDIAGLQRADAEERLNTLPKRKTSPKKFWQYIAAPVLAVALFVTAVAIPGRGTNANDDPPFDISGVQAIALKGLIDDVKKSELEETLSAQTVVVLEGLLAGLEETKHESVMRRAVISAVSLIDGIFENANTYAVLATEFSKTERTQKFGSSITAAVTSYKTPTKITTLQKVNELSSSGDSKIAAALEVSVDALKEEFGEFYGSALDSQIRLFLTPFTAGLAETGYSASDGLYGALEQYSLAMLDICEKILGGGYTSKNIQSQIATACDKYVQSATVALSEQMYNCMMDEFVREKLAEIFGIKSTDLPSKGPNLPDSDGDEQPVEPGEPDDGTNGGGFGEGGVNHGSNDIIYSPEDEKHVEYGEVFNKYYAEAEERLKSGEISEELIKFISEYFKNLDIANDRTGDEK